jgi:hypothetical protein
MKYYLPDFPLGQHERFYVGDKLRYATATDVKFIDDKFLISAQLLNRTLYLIDYSDGFKIIDSIKTNYQPDLFDVKNGLVITANQTYKENQTGGVSLYEIKENKFLLIKDFLIDNVQAHGCKIIDDENILFSSISELSLGIFKLNIKTEKCDKIYIGDKFIRDMDFSGDYIFLTSAPSTPMNSANRGSNNKITCLNYKTLEVVNEIYFGNQSDSIVIKDNLCFLTSQITDEVFCFKIDGINLDFFGKIGGFNFPHGMDVYEDLIAVSNYGDNSIQIVNYKEKLF